MHYNFWNKQPFAINVQKVDELLKPIELFQTDLKIFFHIMVFKSKLLHKFLQSEGIEVILLRRLLLNFEVNFVVLVAVVFEFNETAEF